MISADQVLVNISHNVPQLISLTTSFFYVSGMYIVVVNIAGMRNASILSSGSQNQVSIGSRIKFVFTGIALMYFVSTVNAGIATLFDQTNPYAYVTNHDIYSVFYSAALDVLKLVGIISAGRGIYAMVYGEKNVCHQVLAHFFGGVALINMEGILSLFLKFM